MVLKASHLQHLKIRTEQDNGYISVLPLLDHG